MPKKKARRGGEISTSRHRGKERGPPPCVIGEDGGGILPMTDRVGKGKGEHPVTCVEGEEKNSLPQTDHRRMPRRGRCRALRRRAKELLPMYREKEEKVSTHREKKGGRGERKRRSIHFSRRVVKKKGGGRKRLCNFLSFTGRKKKNTALLGATECTYRRASRGLRERLFSNPSAAA